MGIKEKKVSKKSKGSSISVIMYVVASVVALIGVALLVNNIILYKSTISQAVAQGYDIATVKKALLTSQLLPGMVEPIGLYGGIAFLILGVGIVNKKVSNCLMLLNKGEVCNDIIEESIVEEENVVYVDNMEATEVTEPTEQIETLHEV